MHLDQMDVKTAFLHGDMDKEIYMKQPERFVVPGKEQMVCKLTRSLYGLKQAPRQWYKKFDSFMTKSGFCKAEKDPCCYFKKYIDSYVFLLLYVDDMFIAGSSMREINNLKTRLSAAFEMKDLGPAKQILGMMLNPGLLQWQITLNCKRSSHPRLPRSVITWHLFHMLQQLVV